MAHQNLLHDIYLFQMLSENEMTGVADIAELRTVAADEDVFKQGGEADALYVISSGVIRIHQRSSEGDNIEVAVLGEGSHFGEMSLVDGEPRSATATVIEDSEVLVLDYQKIQDLMSANNSMATKFYKGIARFLCGRLRVTTNDLSYAREKNLRFF